MTILSFEFPGIFASRALEDLRLFLSFCALFFSDSNSRISTHNETDESQSALLVLQQINSHYSIFTEKNGKSSRRPLLLVIMKLVSVLSEKTEGQVVPFLIRKNPAYLKIQNFLKKKNNKKSRHVMGTLSQ
jgi:hypothetical protein